MAVVGDVHAGGRHLFAGSRHGICLTDHLVRRTGHLIGAAVQLHRRRGHILGAPVDLVHDLPQLLHHLAHGLIHAPLALLEAVGQIALRHLTGDFFKLYRFGADVTQQAAGDHERDKRYDNRQDESDPQDQIDPLTEVLLALFRGLGHQTFQVVHIVAGADHPTERLEFQGVAALGGGGCLPLFGEPVVGEAAARLFPLLDQLADHVRALLVLEIDPARALGWLAQQHHIDALGRVCPEVPLLSVAQFAQQVGAQLPGLLGGEFALLLPLIHGLEHAHCRIDLASGLAVEIAEQGCAIHVDEAGVRPHILPQGDQRGQRGQADAAHEYHQEDLVPESQPLT